MKKIILTAFALFVIVSPALADDRAFNIIGGIGAGNYLLSPKDSQVQDYYGGGLCWKGFLEFQAATGLSAIGEVGIFSEGNRSSAAPYGTSLTIIPVTASLSYHFMKNTALSPFVGGGVGIYNINESDPDYTYFKATKFGTHIFAGADLYFSPDSIARFELRQSFIDPVSNSLYYQANFSGITASVALAIVLPTFGQETSMSTEERTLLLQKQVYEAAIQEHNSRLDEMEYYYRQRDWNNEAYHRWTSREALLDEINRTKQQIEDDQAKAEQLKKEADQKRQDYINEKLRRRQEKKDAVTTP